MTTVNRNVNASAMDAVAGEPGPIADQEGNCPRLAERLRSAIEETTARLRGQADLVMHTIVVPDPPPTYDPVRVRKIRTRLSLSQPAFSTLLNVSVKTVQSWEQGVRKPSHASARLLQVVETPTLVAEWTGSEPSIRQNG